MNKERKRERKSGDTGSLLALALLSLEAAELESIPGAKNYLERFEADYDSVGLGQGPELCILNKVLRCYTYTDCNLNIKALGNLCGRFEKL